MAINSNDVNQRIVIPGKNKSLFSFISNAPSAVILVIAIGY